MKIRKEIDSGELGKHFAVHHINQDYEVLWLSCQRIWLQRPNRHDSGDRRNAFCENRPADSLVAEPFSLVRDEVVDAS
ncbi:hypothetical protein D3C80_2093440 [compost metagenome]